MKSNRVSTATRLSLAFGGIVLVVALTGAWVLGGLMPGDAAIGEQSRRDARELDLALRMQAAALAAGQAVLAPAAMASSPAAASGVLPAAAAELERPLDQALDGYARLRQQLDALPPSAQAAPARAAVDAVAAAALLALQPAMASGAEAVTGVPPPGAAQVQAAVQDWAQALQAHAQAVGRAAGVREAAADDSRTAQRRALALALVGAALLAAALGVWAVRGLRRELGTDPGQLRWLPSAWGRASSTMPWSGARRATASSTPSIGCARRWRRWRWPFGTLRTTRPVPAGSWPRGRTICAAGSSSRH